MFSAPKLVHLTFFGGHLSDKSLPTKQHRMLGAGQPEEIGRAVLVAGHFDIGEQFGGVLDLIDQHRRRKPLHEEGRVAFGKGKHHGVL